MVQKHKSEVYLKDLSPHLQNTHIKLNLSFLNELLKNASKSDKPHRNHKFAKRICCPINKTKKSAITIYGWMKGYRTIPFSKLNKIINISNYGWKDVERKLISIKAGIRKGEVHLKFPIRLDKKLGSIIGHILGDGSIDKRFKSIFYSNSCKELLLEFSNNMEVIFGINPRIWVQKRRKFEDKTEWLMRVSNLNEVPKGHAVGLFYPKICADLLYSLLGKFAEGKSKKITKEIKNSSDEFKISLIRAFFDDEGSISANSHTIRFYQDNKKLLQDMRVLLKELNINSHEIKGYMKKGKERHYFNINGLREYYKFYNLIGCTHPKKDKEFISLINKVRNSKRYKNLIL